jgi:hypothetical protein
MTGLDWFQARTLARGGTAVRRDAWRKWLTFESYVWLITQPVWLEQEYDRRVVQQWDFGSAEFLAHDWTDENWPGGPQPPDPPDPPNPPDPPRPPGDGGDGGDGGGGDPPTGDPPGGGDGGGGNTGGGGGSTGGGGGGWPPGGGGGGGPQPPVPPKPPGPPRPPQPDPPTVSVEVFTDVDPDGPGCFIQPPQTCTAYVNVSISGGRAGVGTLRVSGVGTPGIQLGTAYPGFSGGFEFKNVPVNPGGTITYTADYGEPGNAPLTHHTGTGSHKFEPFCLIFGATWHGSMTEDKSCEHDGPSGNTEDGYTYNASYSVNGQYAVNPENGSGKSAQQTPVDVNEGEPHIHWTNDTRPDGTHTEGDIPLYPPGSVTVDVNNGGVSNLQPDTLGMFGESESNETQDPNCSFEKSVDEGSSL